MKNKQLGYAELVIYTVLLVIVLIVSVVFSSWSCGSRWGKSGMQTSWGPIQGCLVQTPNGRWVPDDRVRDSDLEPRQKSSGESIPK